MSSQHDVIAPLLLLLLPLQLAAHMNRERGEERRGGERRVEERRGEERREEKRREQERDWSVRAGGREGERGREGKRKSEA